MGTWKLLHKIIILKNKTQYSGNGKGKVHHVLYPIPILTLMLNKGYCLNIFYTIQGKAQAQALRVRLPTFPYV
jgi:hypothetical protein